MSFIKKQSVGFYFAALAVIAAVVANVFYLINCNTAYFSNLGVSCSNCRLPDRGNRFGTGLCCRTEQVAGVSFGTGCASVRYVARC